MGSSAPTSRLDSADEGSMLLHRRPFAKPLNTQPRRLAAPRSARRKRDNQDRDVARVGQTVRRAGRKQRVQHVARNRAPPLPMTGTNRRLTASRSAGRRAGEANGPSIPRQRCRVASSTAAA
jgi:hypothetical protein